ncbi:MAG: DinB family protein [Candidatus Hydrogenedentota bacterium]
MIKGWNDILWSQFGASIEALEQAIEMCPDDLWQREEVWYLAYHTLFWLDCYLSETLEGFKPPVPFTLDEMDPAGILPDRTYTRDELLAYATHCTKKCRETANALMDELAASPCGFERPRPHHRRTPPLQLAPRPARCRATESPASPK